MTRRERIQDYLDTLSDVEIRAARIRFTNARNSVTKCIDPTTGRCVNLAAVHELNKAETELRDITDKQNRALRALDAHTSDLPIGTLLLVTKYENAHARVIERREHNHAPDDGAWFDINGSDMMTFEEAIGCTETNPQGDEWQRLYVANEVDDLLDRYGIPLI